MPKVGQKSPPPNLDPTLKDVFWEIRKLRTEIQELKEALDRQRRFQVL